ncbi:MAG: hypothetical protein IPM18_07250 [Phycisphaerales bacterium]|nr:hypothetical protein [Phycisphaerales bacterium]
MASFFITHVRYTGGTNRTEVFVVACELVALAFYLRGWAQDRWWKWYAAGLAAGLGFLFKQVGLAAWGCMGLHLLILMGTRELGLLAGVRRGLLLVAGAVTTVAVAAGVLAAQGALGEALYATFGFNRAYFATGDSRFPYNFVNLALLRSQIDDVLLAPLLMAAAATLHAFLWWRAPQHRPPEIETPLRAQRPVCPRYFLLFFLWGVVAFYGALLSPHGFRHYLVPWFPPLLLVAGYLINVLRTEVSLLTRLQQRAWVAVAFVILGYFSYGALWWQYTDTARVWMERVEQREVAEWEYVGAAVARHTRPDERVQIWGFLPGAYLTAKRVNASRYFTTEKVGQVGAGAQHIVAEIEATLRAHPPALIVLSNAERNRMMGIALPPSEFTIFPWIETHYTLAEELPRFGTYYLYRRIESPSAHGGALVRGYAGP